MEVLQSYYLHTDVQNIFVSNTLHLPRYHLEATSLSLKKNRLHFRNPSLLGITILKWCGKSLANPIKFLKSKQVKLKSP